MKPRIIVNCAMSADGKIALPTREQTRISSDEDMSRVHQLRNSVDVIIVGVGTVLADNPSLLVNPKYVSEAKNPVRLVLDSNGRSPEDAAVFDGKARTIVATCEKCSRNFRGAETIRCGRERIDLKKLMFVLGERGYSNALVEGGGEIIWSFFKEGLVDEFKVFVGSMIIGGKDSPTPADGEGFSSLEKAVKLELVNLTRLGEGMVLEYVVKR
ncbi:MAG: 2,5-diamino-6-(ribosylamino)-4(3H)-pyrimidinone 5'-phosphate reductase [Thermoplasmata archaeon]